MSEEHYRDRFIEAVEQAKQGDFTMLEAMSETLRNNLGEVLRGELLTIEEDVSEEEALQKIIKQLREVFPNVGS